jgi:type IV secretion system protein VirB9
MRAKAGSKTPLHVRCTAFLLLLSVCVLSSNHGALAAGFTQPVVSDSRIKTMIYNPNEVFRIVTNYGFQSSIAFGPNEQIQTISLGEQSAWQVIPADNHLFIRALIEVAHSNMTVITDRRTYQFDLFARSAADVPDEELAYVIRFYYPEENFDGRGPEGRPQSTSDMPMPPMQTPMPLPAPVSMSPMPMAQPSMSMGAMPMGAGGQGGMNYRYTLSGPDSIAPVRVYDDGRKTYFHFARPGFRPQIFAVNASGAEVPVTGQAQGDMIAVDALAPSFVVRMGAEVVTVYNEGGRP